MSLGIEIYVDIIKNNKKYQMIPKIILIRKFLARN